MALADPGLVIIGGSWGSHPVILEAIAAATARLPRHVPVRAAKLTDEPSLAGGTNRRGQPPALSHRGRRSPLAPGLEGYSRKPRSSAAVPSRCSATARWAAGVSPARIASTIAVCWARGVVDVALQHRDRVEQVVEAHPGVGAGGREQAGAGQFRDGQVEQRVHPAVVPGQAGFTAASRASSTSRTRPRPARGPRPRLGQHLGRARFPPPAGR